MNRRVFLAASIAAIAEPRAAGAQQLRLPVVGFFSGGSPAEWAHLMDAFRKGLNEAGYVEGTNVVIEYRWGKGRYDRLPTIAAEFSTRPVAVIAAASLPAALAAKTATSVIPIVFAIGGDPVRAGLVASLSKPGGNLTGVTVLLGELGGKRLEILRELVQPGSSVIAVLDNPKNPDSRARLAEIDAAARAAGQRIKVFDASTADEIDVAFARLVRQGAGALLLAADALFIARRDQLVALSARHSLPTVYFMREFAIAGGLISYGSSISDAYRQFGAYIGRVLKGARPANLPVQQPTKFELIINLKTAKALGLTIPTTLLARADELIE